ncbi:beta-ketoacyl synthase N-terminal-like domain-containing protein [Achromobacter aloeverae]
MTQPYPQPIALARQCCAISNIGASWPECWRNLLAGERVFSRGADLIPGWPDSPPLAAILKFPGLEGQPPFARRTDILARIVGRQMRAALDRLAGEHPAAALSLIVATSHGNPGPLSDIADAHHAGKDLSTMAAPLWEGLVADNLVKEVNAGLARELPGVTISGACASSLVAISHAADRIGAGLADAVLIVAIDTLSRVASVGFDNIGAMSRQGCRPYDRLRDGTTVGEGVVAILLARDGLLPPQDVVGRVIGTAVYCDAGHLVEPSPIGMSRVMQGAMQQAGLLPRDVRGIFWHGTGTRQNDKTEAEAARIVFGDLSPPCTSTKGSLGHTMGASGAFNVLAACEAMAQGTLPHVVGATDPEYGNLDLVLHRPRPVAAGPMLVTALGFGGINAAVAIAPCKEFQ